MVSIATVAAAVATLLVPLAVSLVPPPASAKGLLAGEISVRLAPGHALLDLPLSAHYPSRGTA